MSCCSRLSGTLRRLRSELRDSFPGETVLFFAQPADDFFALGVHPAELLPIAVFDLDSSGIMPQGGIVLAQPLGQLPQLEPEPLATRISARQPSDTSHRLPGSSPTDRRRSRASHSSCSRQGFWQSPRGSCEPPLRAGPADRCGGCSYCCRYSRPLKLAAAGESRSACMASSSAACARSNLPTEAACCDF